MNILLVQPQFRKKERAYPLGLAYISAILKQNGHTVIGADLSFTSMEKVYFILDRHNIDLIGISLMSYSLDSAFSFCQKSKSHNSIQIVAGGPHVTALREDILREHAHYFDYLVTGEGDKAFLQLVTSIERKGSLENVGGLIYRKNGGIVSNDQCREEQNLDRFPFPDHTLFPILQYRGMITKNDPYTQIITSRGCDHRCRYCPEPALWRGWRGRHVDNVVEEMKLTKDEHGIVEFHFEDANFLGGGTVRIRDFCLKLIEKNLNVKWQCPNGIPIVDFDDESVLKVMAQSGCYSICLGIETFDCDILNHLERPSNSARINKIIKAAHKEGIQVTGYFMTGFPGQRFKSVIKDIVLTFGLNLDFIHYSIFHIIPGAALYDQYSHDKNFHLIENGKMSVSGVNIKLLRAIRTIASFLYFFKPRVFIYVIKSLLIIGNPFRFIRKSITYLFDMDLKF